MHDGALVGDTAKEVDGEENDETDSTGFVSLCNCTSEEIGESLHDAEDTA